MDKQKSFGTPVAFSQSEKNETVGITEREGEVVDRVEVGATAVGMEAVGREVDVGAGGVWTQPNIKRAEKKTKMKKRFMPIKRKKTNPVFKRYGQ